MKTKILLTAAVAVALAASQAFAASEALMMHNSRAIWQASQDRVNQNFRYWQAKAGASQCGTGCNENGCSTGCNIADSLGCNNGAGIGCNSGCNSGWQKLSGKSIWANYVGRTGSYTSDAGINPSYDADIKSDGIQVGLDLFSDRCTQFGVMFGYEREKSEIGGFDYNTADDFYFGFYAARQLRRGFDIRGYIGYGHQTYDINDPGIWAPVPAQFGLKGDTFESTLELGRRCYLNRHLSYRPVIALDIFNNHINFDDSEVDMSLTQVFARFGSDLQWTRKRLNLNGGAYYSWQMNDAGRNANIADMDNFHLGSSVITLTAGATYYLNAAQTFGVFGNYYGDVYLDNPGDPWQHTFLVGAQYRF